MTARKAPVFALVAVILCAAGGCGSSEEAEAPPSPEPVELVDPATEDKPDAAGTDNEVVDEDEADDPLRTATVEIYFPSARKDGLLGEFRQIFDTATPGDRAKQIIADLISGPTSGACLRAVSPSTRLRQVYVLSDGTAYVDFSSELTEGFGGGSMRELLTVYAIVDSVALGIREVHRVAILVNGRPLETMNGHLDLRRPLKPNPRLILGSIAADVGFPGVSSGVAD